MTRYSKDHRDRACSPTEVRLVAVEAPLDDGPLKFWTRAPDGRRVLVDLTPFEVGQTTAKSGTLRKPAFAGRPRLIHQLAPAVKDQLGVAREDTVEGHFKSFRAWWRVLDLADKKTDAENGPSCSFGVEHLGPLHLQMAIGEGLPRKSLAVFRGLADVTRLAMGLRPLYWRLPTDPEPQRELLPAWQTEMIRIALKRGWYAACDRWEMTERLLRDGPNGADESHLLRTLQVLQAGVARTGLARPTLKQLTAEAESCSYPAGEFPVALSLRAFYPDATDVRMAFHTCMASSGWNASTLLKLDPDEEFIIANPRDASRYVMHSFKPRAQAVQPCTGLFKSQGSPGVIILSLLRRTTALRNQLKRDLAEATVTYRQVREAGAKTTDIAEAYTRVEYLREGVKSAWLYVAANHGIAWLRQGTFQFSNKKVSFLAAVIAKLNEGRPPKERLGSMTARDFRKAYAEYALRVSGGSVVFVQQALAHRSRSSTTTYLNNNIVNTWADQLMADVGEAIWLGVRDRGGLDPVVLALRTRDGKREVTLEERRRLEEYRKLKRSRLGIGCREPTEPPRRIAPTFARDGKRECCVHRCLLCPENARILPESLPGIAMRAEELIYMKSRISAEAFLASSFPEELENAESALRLFETEKVESARTEWRARIADGRHRVVLFDSAA